MSIALIVTRGFGNGTFSGSIADVVTRGYTIGAVSIPQSTAAGGGGAMGGARFTLEDNRDRREQIEEIYAKLMAGPEEIREEAREIVKPFIRAKKKGTKQARKPEIKRVNWQSLLEQITIIERLLALYGDMLREQRENEQAMAFKAWQDEEDELLAILLMVA